MTPERIRETIAATIEEWLIDYGLTRDKSHGQLENRIVAAVVSIRQTDENHRGADRLRSTMRGPRFTIRSMMIAIAVAALASWLGIRLWKLTGIIRLITLVNLGIFATSAVVLVLLNRRQS